MIMVLALTGCSASYNSERLFWKAQQLNAPILKDPAHATPEQFAAAIHAFDQVIQKTPGTLWAARAQLATGTLHAMQKQYRQARDAYALVLQNYNRHQDLCLGARFSTAKTYEAEQNWDEAVRMYRELSDYHPWSVIGLEAPLYIARIYEVRKEPDEATKAYERAAGLYTKLMPDAPTPELATHAKGYLALAYQRLHEWDKAITILEELASAPQGTNRPLILITLGMIYQAKLDNSQKAEEAYTALLKEFPEHPLVKVAKVQLEHLGLSVSPAPVNPATPTTPATP